jgi:hypothetical protein
MHLHYLFPGQNRNYHHLSSRKNTKEKRNRTECNQHQYNDLVMCPAKYGAQEQRANNHVAIGENLCLNIMYDPIESGLNQAVEGL